MVTNVYLSNLIGPENWLVVNTYKLRKVIFTVKLLRH